MLTAHMLKIEFTRNCYEMGTWQSPIGLPTPVAVITNEKTSIISILLG